VTFCSRTRAVILALATGLVALAPAGAHAEARLLIEAATGKVLETVDFVADSCDPHGLAMFDGKLIGCDAGIHPGWPNNDSPTAGWIFQIDFV